MIDRSFVTKEEIQKAKDADLVELIRRCGYEVVNKGPHAHCLSEHDSFVITNNRWIWNKENIGGSTIDFAMHYPDRNGRNFNEAVRFVNQTMYGLNKTYPDRERHIPSSLPTEPAVDKDLILPKRFTNNNRVLAYLNKTRGIDVDIISHVVRSKKLYESSEGHNCVFVGYDNEGVARYGFNRGTFSDKKYARDCPGSSKDYGFVMKGTNDRVFVFESPIDAMSHATIFKLDNKPVFQDSRLSLGGVAGNSLMQYLKDNPKIKRVVFCLDNDETGRNATVRLRHQLSAEFKDRHFEVDTSTPRKKDFNEDLLSFFSRQNHFENGRMI